MVKCKNTKLWVFRLLYPLCASRVHAHGQCSLNRV